MKYLSSSSSHMPIAMLFPMDTLLETEQLQPYCRGKKNKKRDFMQPWLRRRHRRPKISQLNVPYLIKKWYATAFNNGCNMTTACLFVCRQQQQQKKSILLKRLHIKRKSTYYLHLCQEPTIFKSMFIALFILDVFHKSEILQVAFFFKQISAICPFLRRQRNRSSS